MKLLPEANLRSRDMPSNVGDGPDDDPDYYPDHQRGFAFLTDFLFWTCMSKISNTGISS